MFKNYLWIFFISMVPLIELRGAIPVSQALQMPIVSSYIVCIIGNMLPVLPLPGFRSKDIQVEVVGDMLTVRAKRETAAPENAKGHYLKRERSCTEYEETVRLSAPVRGQDATAKYTDGVLQVTIPRESERKQSRRIPVK